MASAAKSPLADPDNSVAVTLAPAASSTPTTSPSSRSAPPAAGPKLRDSCHACASSKVKCHKEKPTCSRCAKRGITCEYFVTRRGGRPNHERRSTITGSHTGSSTMTTKKNIPALSMWLASNSMLPTDLAMSLMVPHPSPQSTTTTPSANFITDACPVDPALGSLSESLADLNNTDIEKFLASPISLSDTNLLSQSDFFWGIESASSSVQGNVATFQDSFCFVDESLRAPSTAIFSPPNSLASPLYTGSNSDQASSHKEDHRPLSSLSGPSESSLPGCCLVKALDLMKDLFPNSTTTCSVSSSPKDDSLLPPNIETVITQNRLTIEALGFILQCPCSQDGYLLSVVALTVFKVLRWYAAAAGKTQAAPSPAETVIQTPAKVGSYCLEGEHWGHMATKLVLSELHRVQRLVNVLSERLQLSNLMDSDASANNAARRASNSDLEVGMTSPFPAAILDQLGLGLKSQLKALSQDIIEGLGKES
ncbi:aflatoxin regulatory protein-domain-containing protein [Stachybotrys elegans]|uniref:Aflatoxin regulatory protein-domain-containing protein n=1 Tax=Stachybotrys elegans TaxID=80388 RepID=A0A8K0WJD1_9HYPO|nr:aflatoxin regulatory protein-domain-containing protein [Stachybotrys elegans]